MMGKVSTGPPPRTAPGLKQSKREYQCDEMVDFHRYFLFLIVSGRSNMSVPLKFSQTLIHLLYLGVL